MKSFYKSLGLLLMLTQLTFVVPAIFAADPPSTELAVATRQSSTDNSGIDAKKFEFEKYIEERKLKYELIKSIITSLSIVIPVLLGIYTVRSQIKAAETLKQIEVNNAFELKAAEIVMGAKNPFGVRRKARVLKALFPEKLPSDFIDSFEPSNFSNIGPSTESKMELLRLLVANPDNEEEIVKLWYRMFPDDKHEQLFPGDFRYSTATHTTEIFGSSDKSFAPPRGGGGVDNT